MTQVPDPVRYPGPVGSKTRWPLALEVLVTGSLAFLVLLVMFVVLALLFTPSCP